MSQSSRFTPEELLALQAVYRGCNTNKRLAGSIYVQNFGTDNEREISYYDALAVVAKMINEKNQEPLLLGCPIKVGDTLYGFPEDEYLKSEDEVVFYTVENIIICKDNILLRYDSYDGTICDLKSLLKEEPFCGLRVFIDEDKANEELMKARQRARFSTSTD